MKPRHLLIALAAALGALFVAAPAQAATCTGGLGTVCGAYAYPHSTWSNGYTTYVTDQDVGCGGSTSLCDDTLTATDPGDWSLTTTMNDSATNCDQVHTYPDAQQLTQNPDGSSIAISAYQSIRSKFAISSPAIGSYEAAYDIWLGNPGQEVMIWVDDQNHDHGETLVGSPVIFGQQFNVYTSGNKANPGEIIVELAGNEFGGTAHIKATLTWLARNGWIAQGETIGQINFGWEICGTGGQPETFSVNSYSLTGVPVP